MTTNEHIHSLDTSADVVVSTCALRLSEKRALFLDAFRVLSPGGRFSITDIVVLRKKPEAAVSPLDALSSRLAGAAQVHHLRTMLCDIGFVDVRVDVELRPNAHQYVVLAELTATKP
jgi:arsenite methyltransferase